MKRCSFRNLTIFFFLIGVSLRLLHAQNLDSQVEHSLEFARQQLIRTVTELQDTSFYRIKIERQDTSFYRDANYPRSIQEDGRWRPREAGHWASGFLPGSLWDMYKWTSDPVWKELAEKWTAGLEDKKNKTGNHEVGFIIYRSFGRGYHLTGREDYKEVLLQAANSLVTRYDPEVGCIISWGGNWGSNNGTVITDGMMMLELLFWAVKNGGDPAWYDMAITHSLKTREENIRPDGSHIQCVVYNLYTGEIIRRYNKQGYAGSTTWSRGQAWGIYGFTMTYRETKDYRFLDIAKRMADYFIDNLPEDYVPYWDFQAPNIPNEEKDASAASIAASGLLELSTLVSEVESREKYLNAAFNILSSLCSPAYLAEGTDSRGILLHGVGNRMKDDPISGEVDVSLIYADHFFIEALLRYLEIESARDPVFPASVRIFQNYPNPFNSLTTIPYSVFINSEFVTLKVFDLLGREVEILVNEFHNPGMYFAHFDASALSSVTYFYQLQTGNFVKSKKMLFLR